MASQRRRDRGLTVSFVSAFAFFQEIAMTIAEYLFIRSHSTVHSYDARIVFAYVVLAIVAIAAIYFAAGGPGTSEAEIASAAVLP
jgi:hypothetical protein